jgi:sulfite exporter TauE/SafE/copper chaperone CopZ
MANVKQHIYIGNMTCTACAARIERALAATPGIVSARVSFIKHDAQLEYDNALIKPKTIKTLIENLGYTQLSQRERALSKRQVAGILLAIVSLWFVASLFGAGGNALDFPLATSGTGYAALFLVGLLTSVHCLAMCGGINLSQCIPTVAAAQAQQSAEKLGTSQAKAAPKEDGSFAGTGHFPTLTLTLTSALAPALKYNLARVVAYTLVGALVGALGSVIVPAGYLRGAVQLAAGVFMVCMGLSMLGVIPGLSALMPRLIAPMAEWLERRRAGSTSPLVVGLLTGLMPCGPLQAMQLYALGTGSPIEGALAMLFFSLGTVPLMLGLGLVAGALSSRFTRRVMAAGACLVVLLGLFMFSSGWALSGLPGFSLGLAGSQPVATGGAARENVGIVEGDVQVVHSTLKAGRYPAITVNSGVPVRWIIDAEEREINGCNNRLILPEYGVEHSFKPGENVIEFVPEQTGTYAYSCWMGMIRSTIDVVQA